MEDNKLPWGSILKLVIGIALTVLGWQTIGYDMLNNNSFTVNVSNPFAKESGANSPIETPSSPFDGSNSSSYNQPPVDYQNTDPLLSNIAIVTLDNGAYFLDACFVLIGMGNEGCDGNQDGQITFAGVPYGTYVLRQTADLGPGRSIPDASIWVQGALDDDGWERFYVTTSYQP